MNLSWTLHKQISEAAAIISKGGNSSPSPPKLYYGLGADATNPTAVATIFEAKERPRLDPLIVHYRRT